MGKVLSTKTFITSVVFILILSLGFIAGIYYIVNEGKIGFFAEKKASDYSPVTSEPISFNLEVNSPDEDTLVNSKSIIVSGKTAARASVIVSNEAENSGIEANAQGDFSKVVNLNLGVNMLSVTAFDDQGDSKTVNRTVYYSEDKLE